MIDSFNFSQFLFIFTFFLYFASSVPTCSVRGAQSEARATPDTGFCPSQTKGLFRLGHTTKGRMWNLRGGGKGIMEQIWWGLDSLAGPLGELCTLGAAVCTCLFVGYKSVSFRRTYIKTRDTGANVGIKPLYKRSLTIYIFRLGN